MIFHLTSQFTLYCLILPISHRIARFHLNSLHIYCFPSFWAYFHITFKNVAQYFGCALHSQCMFFISLRFEISPRFTEWEPTYLQGCFLYISNQMQLTDTRKYKHKRPKCTVITTSHGRTTPTKLKNQFKF